jgi:hypothetical protein
MFQAAEKMQEAEEASVVILDLEDEQTEGNTVTKARAEVKANAKQAFILKRVMRRVKRKLLDWWDILGEDDYGQY